MIAIIFHRTVSNLLGRVNRRYLRHGLGSGMRDGHKLEDMFVSALSAIHMIGGL